MVGLSHSYRCCILHHAAIALASLHQKSSRHPPTSAPPPSPPSPPPPTPPPSPPPYLKTTIITATPPDSCSGRSQHPPKDRPQSFHMPLPKALLFLLTLLCIAALAICSFLPAVQPPALKPPPLQRPSRTIPALTRADAAAFIRGNPHSNAAGCGACPRVIPRFSQANRSSCPPPPSATPRSSPPISTQASRALRARGIQRRFAY